MRHRFHALCPYFAMFPEGFANTWIERLTEPGDLVLDPFCGRGTAPFQALLTGRKAIGSDLNPVAYCVTRAKTNAPRVAVLRRRLTQLERRFHAGNRPQGDWCSQLSAFFQYAYHPMTLEQILFLRASLRWRKSDTDCMLAAIALGALHGESNRSLRYLSNQMPRTISTKPEYSIRFWREHGFQPPIRDAFALLRDLIDYRYASPLPTEKAIVFESDFRTLPGLLRSLPAPVRLVVTSPPYLDVTNFEEDQWLRIWFLGGPPKPTYGRISRDDRHEHASPYWGLIGDVWRVLGRVMAKDAHIVIRMGGRKLAPDRIVAGLEAASVFSGRRVQLLSSEASKLQKRQTDAFRPGSQGCAQEVDCCFHID